MKKADIEKRELLNQVASLLNQEAYEKKALLVQMAGILKKISAKKEKELVLVKKEIDGAAQRVGLGARLFLLFWATIGLMIVTIPAYFCISRGAYELAGEVLFYCWVVFLILMAPVLGRYLGKAGRSKGWLFLLFVPWLAFLFVFYLVFDSSATLAPQRASAQKPEEKEFIKRSTPLNFGPDDRFRR